LANLNDYSFIETRDVSIETKLRGEKEIHCRCEIVASEPIISFDKRNLLP